MDMGCSHEILPKHLPVASLIWPGFTQKLLGFEEWEYRTTPGNLVTNTIDKKGNTVSFWQSLARRYIEYRTQKVLDWLLQRMNCFLVCLFFFKWENLFAAQREKDNDNCNLNESQDTSHACSIFMLRTLFPLCSYQNTTITFTLFTGFSSWDTCIFSGIISVHTHSTETGRILEKFSYFWTPFKNLAKKLIPTLKWGPCRYYASSCGTHTQILRISILLNNHKISEYISTLSLSNLLRLTLAEMKTHNFKCLQYCPSGNFKVCCYL